MGEHSSLDCPLPHPSAKETSNTPQSMNFKYKINQIRSSLSIGLIRELRMNPPNGALLKGLWDVQEQCLPAPCGAVGRHLLRNISYFGVTVAWDIKPSPLPGRFGCWHACTVFGCDVLSKGLFSSPPNRNSARAWRSCGRRGRRPRTACAPQVGARYSTARGHPPSELLSPVLHAPHRGGKCVNKCFSPAEALQRLPVPCFGLFTDQGV